MRFASREKTQFALAESTGVSVPGGGGLEWRSALCGRSRTIEIVCSADGFDADRGELSSFINRAPPDAELDEYVDSLARRISGCDERALTMCKKNIHARAGVPAQADPLDSNHILHTIDDWPEAQAAGHKMGAQGVIEAGDAEPDLPKSLVETMKPPDPGV